MKPCKLPAKLRSIIQAIFLPALCACLFACTCNVPSLRGDYLY